MGRRPRLLALLAVLATTAAMAAACSSGGSSTAASTSTSTSTSTTQPAPTTTTVPGKSAVVLLSVGGNIDAYAANPPFTRQRVVAAGSAPGGIEPHGQICFFPDGSRRFVTAETRPAAAGAFAAGYGVYQLTGDRVGAFRVRRLSGFVSPSAAGSTPSTYGCAFTNDGRLFTTDAGAATGPATGQIVEWLPPLTGTTVAHCVIASGVASPGGLAADGHGGVALASSRAPGAGVWEYTGQFPTSGSACGALNTVSPTAPAGTPRVTTGVAAAELIHAGPHGLSAPSAVASSPDGRSLVVTSAPDGVIARYSLAGAFQSILLAPSAGEQLAATPRANGTPQGVAVNADGTVFYADPGLVRSANGTVAPAAMAGSLRRVTVTNGQAGKPQALKQHLPAPDGLGIFDPQSSSGGAGSIT
jgi:sugar lactone lactonase YvrE